MTRQELREYYAGLAMQIIHLRSTLWNDNIEYEVMAKRAILFADALIAELKCKHEITYELHSMKYCKHCQIKLD